MTAWAALGAVVIVAGLGAWLRYGLTPVRLAFGFGRRAEQIRNRRRQS